MIGNFLKNLVIFLIRVYQAIFSQIFSYRCRFYPSCSKYAIYAIETHGIYNGLLLTIKRILRCRASYKSMEDTAGKSWGYDPVPENIDN